MLLSLGSIPLSTFQSSFFNKNFKISPYGVYPSSLILKVRLDAALFHACVQRFKKLTGIPSVLDNPKDHFLNFLTDKIF